MTDRIPVKAVIASGAATALAEFETGDQIANQYLHAAPPVLSGGYLSRPAYSAVPAGTIYESTDTGELYRSSASAWVLMPGGKVLALATISSNVVRAPGATGDIPGLSATFTAGESVVSIEFGGTFDNSAASTSNYPYFMIKLDGAVVGQIICASVGGFTTGSRCVPVSGLTPGSTHSVAIEFQSIGSGTSTLYSLPADRPYMTVRSS
ncbi:hypothetical protein AB4071_02680 [Stenotrophomonas sp. 2MCAF14_2]|uniref:hypothetical protein n=1 Tax=Stenotrophomonas sp. 2MCAF14_2 TaxID=3232983 RepID=UPI003F982855